MNFLPGQSVRFTYHNKDRVVRVKAVGVGPKGLYVVCETPNGYRSFRANEMVNVRTV